MSVIIAGTKCKLCNQSYWVSFGHPKWFSDYLRNKIETDEVKEYSNIQSSGLCLLCYLQGNEVKTSFWKAVIMQI